MLQNTFKKPAATNIPVQEVNAKDQFSGEVLLHLYNDGTVEKKIVK